jgi:hypothetical protein
MAQHTLMKEKKKSWRVLYGHACASAVRFRDLPHEASSSGTATAQLQGRLQVDQRDSILRHWAI